MRPNRRAYFMKIAADVSTRATCDRAHVGAILVKGNRIIATGYNGSPHDLPHCDEVGHDMVDSHCVRTIHAEENAILQCAEVGVSAFGSTLYCTVHPCVRCASRLFQVGVRDVWYAREYSSMSQDDRQRIKVLADAGLSINRYDSEV